MEIIANPIRLWTSEENTSLAYIASVLTEDELRSTGFLDFVAYFQTRGQRTLRLEAICYTVINLRKMGLPSTTIHLLLKTLPQLVENGIYDIHIEEYLESARLFTSQHRHSGFIGSFFKAYTSPAASQDRKFFEGLTVFTRHYSVIFDGEMKKPSPSSLLYEAASVIFKFVAQARTEEEILVVARLLDLSTDISSHLIITGPYLCRGDIRYIRSLLNWIIQIPSLQSLVFCSPYLNFLHRHTLTRMKTGQSGVVELWKTPLIKS